MTPDGQRSVVAVRPARRGAAPEGRTDPLAGLTVLNLEDSHADAELTHALLCANLPACQFKVVSKRPEYVAELQRPGKGYDVILCDFTLPAFDGFEAFRLARQHSPGSAFIFYSGTIPDDVALQATRLGATDYVNKDRPIRLVTAIVRARREHDEAERRRAAEAELRRSEGRYRLLVEQASDAVFVHDGEGRLCEVNRRAVTVLGYSREELLRMHVWDFEQTVPAEKLKANWAELKHDMPMTFYGRHRRKDGGLFPVEIRLSRFDVDGEGRFLALVRDITARVAAEARIREQNELLNKAKDAIIVLDMESRVLFWNRGAERLFGYTAAEAMGGVVGRFTGNADISQFVAARQAVVEHGEWAGAIQGENRHGQEINLEMWLSLVRDDAGQPRAVIAIGSDVTEKQKLREQFYRMQRLESVGALAAGIAHDLNNILAPITLAVPMLRAHTKRPQDLRLLQMVETSALRGTGLVQQVLAFAHGRGGEFAAIQVKHLLADAVDLMKATFPKGIAVEYAHPAGLWPVRGNATQIHQILLNLCINARDAMPDGGTLKLLAQNVTLDELSAHGLEGARPGAWLMISIEDTGCGIAPEVLPHIWEPFFTTKKDRGGTGLGLATVRDIIGHHAGFVTLATEPGRGTAFHVYLPAVTQAEDAALAATPGEAPHGQGEQVLVVEDEQIIRDVIVAVLARHGYAVIEANDGIAGLETFITRSAEFRLVVTDVDMPGMDGITLGRIIRKMNPRLALLIVSGSEKALSDLSTAGWPPGALLMKPFTAETLLQRVHGLLEKCDGQ